jgi:hypothetical protein
MSISWNIPKNSQFVPINTIFTAQFNIPIAGKYSFSIPANSDRQLIEMKKNSVYLIERISIGGTIGEENYFSALDVVPEFILKKSISGERIYPKPLPIVNYCDGAEIVAWVLSAKSGDFLTGTLQGSLIQTAELNGLSEIKISIALTVYEITNTAFYSRFIDREGLSIGKQVTGGDYPDCGSCGLK